MSALVLTPRLRRPALTLFSGLVPPALLCLSIITVIDNLSIKSPCRNKTHFDPIFQSQSAPKPQAKGWNSQSLTTFGLFLLEESYPKAGSLLAGQLPGQSQSSVPLAAGPVPLPLAPA